MSLQEAFCTRIKLDTRNLFRLCDVYRTRTQGVKKKKKKKQKENKKRNEKQGPTNIY